MSMHRPTCDPATTRSVSSPVSTIVPDVRVEGRDHATLGRAVADPVEVGEHRRPAGRRRARAASSYPSTPVKAARTTTPAPVGEAAVDERVDLGHRVVGGVVQQHRQEASDGLQVVGGELLGLRLGLVLEEPGRAELGGGEPQLAHLAENRGGVELVAPAGDLADPPGDRGARDAGADGQDVGGVVGTTGRSRLRLSSQARHHVNSLS